MKRFARFLVLFSAILLVLPVGAQDETHPLLEMLAFIPDTDVIRYGYGGVDQSPSFYPSIFYTDYTTFEQYTPTDITVNSFEEYFALSDDEQLEWYGAVLLRSVFEPALPRPFQTTGNERDPVTFQMTGGPPVAEAVKIAFGFDYFDIERGLIFGNPPAQGTIFGVDYDVDSLDTALSERGYTDASQMDVQIWCQIETGCDGSAYDRNDIEPENIFDTRLGRKPPIIAADGYLYSVFDEELITTLIETQVDAVDSLADADDYRVLVSAITSIDVDLVQAMLFNGLSAYANVDLSDYEVIEDIPMALQIPQWADYQQIPLPTLVALTDHQAGDSQIISLVALYQTEAGAEFARDELARRMTQFSGEQIYDNPEIPPFIESIPTEVTPLEPTIYLDEATEFSAVVVSFSMGQVEDEAYPAPYYGNQLLARWADAFYSGAFYPLWDIALPDWFIEEFGS